VLAHRALAHVAVQIAQVVEATTAMRSLTVSITQQLQHRRATAH
jgi:hypothetical protein